MKKLKEDLDLYILQYVGSESKPAYGQSSPENQARYLQHLFAQVYELGVKDGGNELRAKLQHLMIKE